MKTLLLILSFLFFGISCTNPTYQGIKTETLEDLKENLDNISDSQRKQELKDLIKATALEQREGMAYLIAYMSSNDLDTLNIEILKSNVEYAYKARETFPWAKNLEEDIFLNEVLPYSSVNETREAWRKDFYELFAPLVSESEDIFSAVDTINKRIIDIVGVVYSTERKKANQSAFESMELGLASCTGLSVLLTNALRSVGIPSRLAGTPMWATGEGNHTWNEVYIDGKWYFLEYYYAPLDTGWLLPRAAQAREDDPMTWVYASSYKPTDIMFPLSWSSEEKSIHAQVVTKRYQDIYKAHNIANGVTLGVKIFKYKRQGENSANRIKTKIQVVDANRNVVAEGSSATPFNDMNDYFTATIKDLDQEYTIKWQGKDGIKTTKVEISEPTVVILYFDE